jgi:hypothetical protein
MTKLITTAGVIKRSELRERFDALLEQAERQKREKARREARAVQYRNWDRLGWSMIDTAHD